MIGAADLSPTDRKRGVNAIMIGQFFVTDGFLSLVIGLSGWMFEAPRWPPW